MKKQSKLMIGVGHVMMVAGLFFVLIAAFLEKKLSIHGLVTVLVGALWVNTDRVAEYFYRYKVIYAIAIALLAAPIILTILTDLGWIKLPEFIEMDGVMLITMLAVISVSDLDERMKELEEGEKK
ncbi:hypothetical protein ACTGZM_06200 [Streptococcus suis]